jgi:hypothetical protein
VARMCAFCEEISCKNEVLHRDKLYYVCEKHAAGNVLKRILEKTQGF